MGTDPALQNINETIWKLHWIKAGLKDIEVMLSSEQTGAKCSDVR